MWTKITFEEAIRYGEGKVILTRGYYHISLADASGTVLHLDDGSRLAVVSRFTAKPYDVDDNCVDGETVPDVATGSPEFLLWEE